MLFLDLFLLPTSLFKCAISIQRSVRSRVCLGFNRLELLIKSAKTCFGGGDRLICSVKPLLNSIPDLILISSIRNRVDRRVPTFS